MEFVRILGSWISGEDLIDSLRPGPFAPKGLRLPKKKADKRRTNKLVRALPSTGWIGNRK